MRFIEKTAILKKASTAYSIDIIFFISIFGNI